MSNPTNSSSQHVLIDGTFDARDAQEILLTLVNAKIEYHSRRCMGSDERFGMPDPVSEQRRAELEATRDALRKTLGEAIAAGRSVRIHSAAEVAVEPEVKLPESPVSNDASV